MLKKIKFCIAALFAVCLLSAGSEAFAAPICPVPTEVTQPDGTVITVTAYGDEFFSWKEDENGNVIAYDEETDSYKYAEIEDGKLVPSSETVGKSSLLRCVPQRLQREDVMPLWENAERTDYTQPYKNGSIALISADGESEQEKPLTHRKLLTLLIEFNDVKLVQTTEFWQKRMFSTNPKDLSVVNYWKENSNGLNVFEPADTFHVQDGANGMVSYEEDYIDIGYTITKCPEGVVKVSLDMPHPIKTWNNDYATEYKVVSLALQTVEPYMEFTEYGMNVIAIFAGYDMTTGQGDGKGQILANVSGAFMCTSDGIPLGKFVVQGEMTHDTFPAGIGTTCHELGHAVFNLPDLYFSNMPNGGYAMNGLALYSLMSLGCWGHLYNHWEPSEHNIWNDPYAYNWSHVPAHLDPWCKIQCGYVTPTIVNEWDGNLNSISEVGADGKGVDSEYNVLEIRSKTAANQYFLVENRQLVGYDCGLERLDDNFHGESDFNGGIVIYHVDGGIYPNHNNNSEYHRFISAERSDNSASGDASAADWVYINKAGRNKFGPDTAPNSNLHELRTGDKLSCDPWTDCHPQTLKSGISIEVLGDNGPSVRVKANVDEEYRVTMVEGAKFADLFPDANFCSAVLDNMRETDGIIRNSDSVLTIRDWAVLAGINSMDISGYGIKDLTGIEYFTILDTLVCRDNELTSLDRLTPEQIGNIDTLNCGNNKLTELDLSEWDNLTWFYCDNNLLTSLTLPESEQLFRIECQNNRLRTLDLTNSPGIEFLFCYGNYMDAETPSNSILGMDSLHEELGPPHSKDDPGIWFAYYPQNIPDAEHNWDSAWQKDDTHHWHNCTNADCPIVSNADKDGYGEHTWDSGNVTKQPTCSAAGIKTYTCSVCQALKTEEIASTGQHTLGEWEIVTPATTKKEGLRIKKCTVCQAELQRETIPKLKLTSPSPSIPDPVEPDPPNNDPANCPKDENCPLRRYTDTDAAMWYHNGIHYCVENGLMNGEGNGKFAPNAVLTRGMLAQILYNNAGRPAVTESSPFDDVAAGVWYANAVVWAAESKIVTGYGNGRFGPNDPITREQLVTVLWRYAQRAGNGGIQNGTEILRFPDTGDVADWAKEAMTWAVDREIIRGRSNGTLDPGGKATRAEAAAVLMRFFGKTR